VKRRDFLSICGLAAGSCLVPDAIARVIRDTCLLAQEPYLVLPRDPRSTLYALSTDRKFEFMLHLGDPSEEIPLPTWKEHRSTWVLGVDPANAGPVRARRAGRASQYFYEYEGIDINDKEAVKEWWRDQVGDPEDDPITIQADDEHRSARALGVDPADAGPARARRVGASESNLPFGIDPDGAIDGVALDRWETHQELIESPAASAFHYLRDLPLDDDRGLGESSPLGELSFIQGDRPGSNLTYVEAPDLATLACLQNRLNEIGENLAIEIRGW